MSGNEDILACMRVHVVPKGNHGSTWAAYIDLLVNYLKHSFIKNHKMIYCMTNYCLEGKGLWLPLWYLQTLLRLIPLQQIYIEPFLYEYIIIVIQRGRRGRDRMVVGFTATYAISVYHHWCCEFESRSGRGVQHYVIKFVSDLRQVGVFLRVLRFPPPIKLTGTI